MNISKSELTKAYQAIYSDSNSPLRYFFAPGRVNLIGEHIDYNGGHVFPCALDFGTYAVVASRTDNQICLYSNNFSQDGVYKHSLNEVINKISAPRWVNYCLGVIKHFIDHNYTLPHGLNIYICGNIPTGAGVSSSASIEILMALILNSVFAFKINEIELVKWCKEVENNFIGVNCGIMDQFAIMMSKPKQALLLNCASLDYQYANCSLTDYTLVIANTNKKRTLADSKYNERKNECDELLAILQYKLGDYTSLAQIPPSLLSQSLSSVTDDTLQKRLRHVVSEENRTLMAFEAINANQLLRFGKLMNQSHLSLQHDYEVTGFELDTMVNLAWNFAGCIGSRMTGAGFGGCTISLVENSQVNRFINEIGSQYHKHTGLTAEFYITHPSSGAHEI
jgi:galactokinase